MPRCTAMTVMETRNAHNKVNQSKQNLVFMERFQVMNQTILILICPIMSSLVTYIVTLPQAET